MAKDLLRVLVVVAVLAILIIGGIAVYKEINKNTVVILQQNQNSQTIRSGEKLILKLPSNPSTGYSWFLNNNYNKNVVNLVSQKYLSPAGDNAIGSAGTEEFTFVGVAKGQTNITFNYIRPWEKNSIPALTKTYQITVN